MSSTNGKHPQVLDRNDPTVARFVRECGLAGSPVSIRLVGVSKADLDIQIQRLERAYGGLVRMTTPRQSGKGSEWIAYGTILA
jgi:hypothetical protein